MMDLGIRREHLGHDLLASIVVFLVALPLCMGIALASGAPPALGLITGIIGGLVVGVLAGSPLQVSGPAAGLAVIIWELVQKYGLEMLGPIVLLGGAIQFAAGWMKLGRYFRAIAPPVIYGMLAGIGVLIFAAQFHVMVDDAPRGSGLKNLIAIPEAVYKGIFPVDGSSHHIAAMLGLMTIGVIVLWTRFKPHRMRFLPGPLLGALVATALAAALKMPVSYVDVPENLFDAVSWPTWETMSRMATDPALIGAAFALAVIASTETLLCAVAVDRMHQGPRTQFDRELSAQGIGNLLCGLCGALPMTGVIVRSGANVEAGARTRLSAILHGAWLLALVALFPELLRKIPTSSLAAILVYTGYKLVNPANLRKLQEYGRIPVAIYFVTLIGIVATDLLKGVLLGVALTVVRLVYELTHFELKVETRPDSRRVDLHLIGAATFVALPKLAAALDHIPPGSEVHVHIQRLGHIDHACLDAIAAWQEQGSKFGSAMQVEWEELMSRFQREKAAPVLALAGAGDGSGAPAGHLEGVVALSAEEYAEEVEPRKGPGEEKAEQQAKREARGAA
jgi:MFS superfamily sulfate permease-like transporter